MEKDELYACLEWAKGRGYTGAEAALEELAKKTGETLVFESTVWSGGEYYTIVKK